MCSLHFQPLLLSLTLILSHFLPQRSPEVELDESLSFGGSDIMMGQREGDARHHCWYRIVEEGSEWRVLRLRRGI